MSVRVLKRLRSGLETGGACANSLWRACSSSSCFLPSMTTANEKKRQQVCSNKARKSGGRFCAWKASGQLTVDGRKSRAYESGVRGLLTLSGFGACHWRLLWSHGQFTLLLEVRRARSGVSMSRIAAEALTFVKMACLATSTKYGSSSTC